MPLRHPLRHALLIAALLGAASIGEGPAAPSSAAPAAVGAAPSADRFDDLAARAAARAGAGVVTAQEEGSRLESFTRFTLDPAATAVHVLYEATITNLDAPSYPYYSYLPQLGIPVMKEAVGVAASRQDGSPLSVAMEATGSPFVAMAVIDLEPDLYYQDAAAIRLTYDLPPMGARAEGFTRLNDAFATFPVFAVGDAGVASVEVVIPERFEVELIGSELDRSERDGQQVFAETAVADTDEFGVDVVARDDDRLTKQPVELGEHDATVLGWPGDDEWVGFVADQIGRGVPELGKLLGIPWPAEDDLDVVETVSPYLYGYAGWYQPRRSLIEVGDELDQHVILHELSHLWFNDDLYASRWINEGLADVYATRVMTALGGAPEAPDPIDPAAPGAVRLEVWEDPQLQSEGSFEQEGYGYNASWSVVEQVVAEIGIEKLSAVVQASRDRALAYAAPGDGRRLPMVHTWHQLLDLLDSVGGSATAEGLFRAHVVAPEDLPDLDARATARAAYEQLRTDALGWAPPFAVREAMSMWDFEEATELISQTQALLPTLRGLVDELDDVGLALPVSVRQRYERFADVDALGAALDEHLRAVRTYAAAVEARAGNGPLAAVGLAFRSADLRLATARAALAAGEFEAASAEAAAVRELAEEATEAAVARTSAVLLLVALVLLVRRSGAQVPAHVADPLRRAAVGVVRRAPGPRSVARFATQRHTTPPPPPRPDGTPVL